MRHTTQNNDGDTLEYDCDNSQDCPLCFPPKPPMGMFAALCFTLILLVCLMIATAWFAAICLEASHGR